MYYMGVDHHKQYSHMTILDKEGAVLKEGIVNNDQEDIREFLLGMESVKAVVEASRTSYVMADLLEWMGVDIRIANPIEIGDISRFSKVEKLHAYSGVIPSVHSSGGRIYHGKIIKAGNKWLRWAVIEAVWPAIKVDVRLKVFYQNRAWRKGPNVAKVATARRMLTIVYRVLKEERAYDIR